MILVTNDDGIYAPGIKALYQELASLGVAVVAPDTEQSAVGHSISLSNPLRVNKLALDGIQGWSVTGTPADCVKIALAELLPERPEMVVSGINLGPNVGINVLYSGTVSAATEATILGLKAMAFSLNTYMNADFATAARLARQVMERFRDWPGWQQKVCLNINLPALPEDQIQGIKIVHQDTGPLVEHFERRIDPRERVYYWLAEINKHRDPDLNTDYGALQAGYITVTPICFDLTHYPTLEALRHFNGDLREEK